jgi:carboxypeptidase C (cathepsin A)
MAMTSVLRVALVIFFAGALSAAIAQEGAPAKAPDRSAAEHQSGKPGVLRLLPGDSVTDHSIDTAQGKLAYTATAGTLAFFDQSGEGSASVFYTAYVAKDGGPERPLTFVFNGGPGAASAFLNLGLVGRACSISGRTGMMQRMPSCATTQIPGCALPTWC